MACCHCRRVAHRQRRRHLFFFSFRFTKAYKKTKNNETPKGRAMSKDNSKMRRAGKPSVDIKRGSTFGEKAYAEGDFKNTLRTQVRDEGREASWPGERVSFFVHVSFVIVHATTPSSPTATTGRDERPHAAVASRVRSLPPPPTPITYTYSNTATHTPTHTCHLPLKHAHDHTHNATQTRQTG